MKTCKKCAKELRESDTFCPGCGAVVEVIFPAEELGFLKADVGIFKDEAKKNMNVLKEELDSQKGKLDTMSIKIEDKKEERVGVKIASIILLVNGMSYLALGGIIAGIGSALLKLVSTLPMGMVPGVVAPTTAMLDTAMYVGLILLGIGILSVSLPYYLWKGNKAAATITVVIMMVALVATIYELIILSDMMPAMSQGFMWASVPEAILAILPMLLINKDWEALK